MRKTVHIYINMITIFRLYFILIIIYHLRNIIALPNAFPNVNPMKPSTSISTIAKQRVNMNTINEAIADTTRDSLSKINAFPDFRSIWRQSEVVGPAEVVPPVLPIRILAKRSTFAKVMDYISQLGKSLSALYVRVVENVKPVLLSLGPKLYRWGMHHRNRITTVGFLAVFGFIGIKMYKALESWYKGLAEYEILLDDGDLNYQAYGKHWMDVYESSYRTAHNNITSTSATGINLNKKYKGLYQRINTAHEAPCFPRTMTEYVSQSGRTVNQILTEIESRIRSHSKFMKLRSDSKDKSVYVGLSPLEYDIYEHIFDGILLVQARQLDAMLRSIRLQLLSAANNCEDLLENWKKRLVIRSQSLRLPFPLSITSRLVRLGKDVYSTYDFSRYKSLFRSSRYPMMRSPTQKGMANPSGEASPAFNTTIDADASSSSRSTSASNHVLDRVVTPMNNLVRYFVGLPPIVEKENGFSERVVDGRTPLSSEVSMSAAEESLKSLASNPIEDFTPNEKVALLESLLDDLYKQAGVIQAHLSSLNSLQSLNHHRSMSKSTTNISNRDKLLLWKPLEKWIRDACSLSTASINVLSYPRLSDRQQPLSFYEEEALISSSSPSSYNSTASQGGAVSESRLQLNNEVIRHILMKLDANQPYESEKLDEFIMEADLGDFLEKCIMPTKIISRTYESMNLTNYDSAMWRKLSTIRNFDDTILNKPSSENLLVRQLNFSSASLVSEPRFQFQGPWFLPKALSSSSNNIDQIVQFIDLDSLITDIDLGTVEGNVTLYSFHQPADNLNQQNFTLRWDFESILAPGKASEGASSTGTTIEAQANDEDYQPRHTKVTVRYVNRNAVNAMRITSPWAIFSRNPSPTSILTNEMNAKRDIRSMVATWRQHAFNSLSFGAHVVPDPSSRHHDFLDAIGRLSMNSDVSSQQQSSASVSMFQGLFPSTSGGNTAAEQLPSSRQGSRGLKQPHHYRSNHLLHDKMSLSLQDHLSSLKNYLQSTSTNSRLLRRASTSFYEYLEVKGIRTRSSKGSNLLRRFLSVNFWLRLCAFGGLVYTTAEACRRPDEVMELKDTIVKNIRFFVHRRIFTPSKRLVVTYNYCSP
jgi:hypothetical protein